MPTISIDGKKVEVQAGQTVIEAAKSVGIVIPSLCHHPDLKPVGSCRLCMVSVEGMPGQVAACTLQPEEGMSIRNDTEELTASRKFILEMLLEDFRDQQYTHSDQPETEFETLLRQYGLEAPKAEQANDPSTMNLRHPIDSDSNPVVWVDLNKCILCSRCVRACSDIQGRFVWGIGERGAQTKLIAGNDTTMLEARCESCGLCSTVCPTGALDDRISIDQPSPDRKVKTTCTYCGVGCQLELNIKDEKIRRVTSFSEAPVNGHSLCVKGRYGFDFVHHADRVLRPRVREYLLKSMPKPSDGQLGPWVEVNWSQALEIVSDRFADIWKSSGGDGFGLFSSAKCTNEENYLMQKLARQVLQTNNVDHCARLCHSSSVSGLVMSLGSGAMSNSMSDMAEESNAVFIIGSNTTEQHPVFGTKLRQAVQQRNLKLVVADPREIEIAEFATLHLRQRPGTDGALLNGIMHVIVENDWHDSDFIQRRCENFDDVYQSLKKYDPDYVETITGVPADQIIEAATIFAENHPMTTIWGMGISQHTTGVLNVLAICNLQLMLGNLGMPGGGVNPLRGQNNVQGACDMGALPDLFPGYQSVTQTELFERFSDHWRCDGPSMDESLKSEGLIMTEIIESAAGELVRDSNHDGSNGKQKGVRAIYIMGEDPAMTEPDLNHAHQNLQKSEFIVLQDILETETAKFADVLLPGASFAEKDGTFTNTERRIQLVRQAIEPLGSAKPDWTIISQIAKLVLTKLGRTPQGPWANWDYESPSSIMEEIAAVTPSYRGVSFRRLQEGEQLQWPVPSKSHEGTPVLYENSFTRGKGKFHVVDHLEAEELPDDEYPLLLTTGRVIYHWHGGEMTRRAQVLSEVCPDNLIEISFEDARRFNISDGQSICVSSRRGQMTGLAVITSRVSSGIVFASFHFPDSQNANNLTIRAFDPISKIPEYKVCAVAVSGQ